MELNGMEKRMLYQTEGCERYAVINELPTASQYAGNPARRKVAKDLMEKLHHTVCGIAEVMREVFNGSFGDKNEVDFFIKWAQEIKDELVG